LPQSFDAWKNTIWRQEGFGWQWEALRPFFLTKGYDLYVYHEYEGLKPRVRGDPNGCGFGLHGTRTDFTTLPILWCMKGEIWGARDLENRDVVIKPVSYGARSTNELQILKYLNSDALRADKANTTVPVVEFLEYSGWTFAITQRWNDSVIPEFVDIGEVLEWADISHENFLMNYWGVFPPERDRGTKPPKLRKNFAVKYALIDFGYSVQLPPDLDEPSRRGVWPVPREQSAPETKTGAPFDPFAADVYQAGRTIYGW
ncbi:hypothetical protein BOTBODRAFT_72912, partial [Botryobasidium botryosum FD-172 SS1]